MIQYFIYVVQVLGLTLGVMAVCGLVAWFARRVFMYLVGDSARGIYYASSIVGTPVHELGHALMCIPFAHRIIDMKLLTFPKDRSRTLGYVQHSYKRKNQWAAFGELFISFGPIFSGLGVMILVLTLCFPTQWNAYRETSRMLVESGASVKDCLLSVFSLLLSLFSGFKENLVPSLIGIFIILSVSQHITLSFADLKGCLKAFLMYTGGVIVFAAVTMLLGWRGVVVSALNRFNLRLLSIFCIAMAFSLVWVIIGVAVFILRWTHVTLDEAIDD